MAGTTGFHSVSEAYGLTILIPKSSDTVVKSYPTSRPSRDYFFVQGVYTIPTRSLKYAHKPRHIYDPDYNYKM